jgi:hypothetical protein
VGAVFALTAMLAACGGPPSGVDEFELANAIAGAIGDPNTCVVLAKAPGGQVMWEHQLFAECNRALPSCEEDGGTQTARDLARRAAAGEVVRIGCSNLSWAAGPTPREGVVYAALMQGERALPGREIARRLEGVFERTGF